MKEAAPHRAASFAFNLPEPEFTWLAESEPSGVHPD